MKHIGTLLILIIVCNIIKLVRDERSSDKWIPTKAAIFF